MASIHYKSFVDFVNTGKTQRHGALVMAGETVFSYKTVIAKVDRANKVIDFCPKKYSVTTSRHQNAVTTGLSFLGSGWSLNHSL
jgi:uncharacterized membrane protein YhiD involved in acid resistance